MGIEVAVTEKRRNGKALGAAATKPIVIVGLGNPGRKYLRHRHNLGFMVVDLLANEIGSAWKTARDNTLICEGRIEGVKALLVKPQTYMNLSGRAVVPVVKKHAIAPDEVVVIHDDMDLVLGRVRIKTGGGDGGHRGVRSMAECLGTRDFVRVRLGVGRPPVGVVPEEFVLSPFGPEERDAADELVKVGKDAVTLVVTDGWERARNAIHAGKNSSL